MWHMITSLYYNTEISKTLWINNLILSCFVNQPILAPISYVTKRCPTTQANQDVLRRVYPQPRSFKHYVSCCKAGSSSDQVVCASECSSQPVTFEEAKEHCSKSGQRLCVNSDEEVNSCCNSGCDTEWIWVGDLGIASHIYIYIESHKTMK